MTETITLSYPAFVSLVALATTGGIGLVTIVAASIAAAVKKK